MYSLNSFKTSVFSVNNQNFEQHAIELFHFQYKNNTVYKAFVDYLNIHPNEINTLSQIPFLPIRFFKSHQVKTGKFEPACIFESSGTTGSRSKHYIEDLEFYKKVSERIFESIFGAIDQSIIIGLLPSYLERANSSLVYMVNHFIAKSENASSGFYLDNLSELSALLTTLSISERKVVLFGVTFALMEFAERFHFDMNNLVVLETGGMKGRGSELIREELHKKLAASFNTDYILSEYGMTELLSQAYLQKDGLFHTPPWMRVSTREIHDPFCFCNNGKTGVLNIIDLANVHSCAFIETEDLGIMENKGFKVLGRLDNSDLRGCNLLLS